METRVGVYNPFELNNNSINTHQCKSKAEQKLSHKNCNHVILKIKYHKKQDTLKEHTQMRSNRIEND